MGFIASALLATTLNPMLEIDSYPFRAYRSHYSKKGLHTLAVWHSVSVPVRLLTYPAELWRSSIKMSKEASKFCCVPRISVHAANTLTSQTPPSAGLTGGFSFTVEQQLPDCIVCKWQAKIQIGGWMVSIRDEQIFFSELQIWDLLRCAL